MGTFDEEKKNVDEGDDLLKLLENQEKKAATKKTGGIMAILKGLPIGTIIIAVVVIILGVMVLSLASNIAALRGEIGEIKGIKTQLAEMEGRLERSGREKDGLRSEISRLSGEIESLKTQRREAEARAQQQKQQQEQAAKKKRAKEKTKPVAQEKPKAVPTRR
ncbi:MAG: IncA protein [Syntrophorhabdus sp. PtaU1.Bin153]|nr:MAG: IncA protein [Syntrophorhabdus sp. PtaU1.Bin153]